MKNISNAQPGQFGFCSYEAGPFHFESEKRKRLHSGRGIIDLSMINPDIPPPRILQDRLIEAALNPTFNRYSVSRGIRRLREAFASKYEHLWKVSLCPETEVCVTFGAKDGTLHLLRLLSENRKKIILPYPCYPAYRAAAELSGLKVGYFHLSTDREELLKSILQTLDLEQGDVLLLNFPNNPTGMEVDSTFFNHLVLEARKRDLTIIHDLVYGELGFDRAPQPSLLGSAEGNFNELVEIYSMSKAYSIPGWRVAAVSGDSKYIQNLSVLKSRVDYGNFLPIQHAAAYGLMSKEDLCGEIASQYATRFRFLRRCLTNLDWEVNPTNATPLAWCRVPEGAPMSGTLVAKELLEQFGISVSPGILYGDEYDQYLRVALVVPEEHLQSFVKGVRTLAEKW